MSNLKAFADDKFNLAKNMKYGFYRVENIVGKGENAGNQHFPPFPQCFQRCFFFQGRSKSGLCGKELVSVNEPIFNAIDQ